MGLTVSVIPSLLYRDANAGIAWLKAALGFEEKAVYRDENGVVEHAELVLGRDAGGGMLMLGTAGRNLQTAAWYAMPDECGNRVTGAVYLIVPDCGPVYEEAKATGAEVLLELRTMDYGGQAFTVRDPEGHIWSVGEYDPWKV